MQIPDEIRLSIELVGLAASAGVVLMKLGRLGERFDQHGKQLDTAQAAIDKIEGTLEVVAVQKDQIQSIRDAVAQNRKETSETFSRIFNTLERLQAK
jgi:hypothetical protein